MNKKTTYNDIINDQQRIYNINLSKQHEAWEKIAYLETFINFYDNICSYVEFNLKNILEKKEAFKNCECLEDVLEIIDNVAFSQWQKMKDEIDYSKYVNISIFELQQELMQVARWKCEEKEYFNCNNIIDLHYCYIKYGILHQFKDNWFKWVRKEVIK